MISDITSKVWKLPTIIFDSIVGKIRRAYFQTLPSEDLEDLIKEKEEEIEDLTLLEEKQLEEIKEEMRNDLRQFGYDEDEIEEMVETALGDD